MKIVVMSSLAASLKAVEILRQGGHEVVAAAPNTGINTITGEGLKGLAGVQIVIDLANSPSVRGQGHAGVFPDLGPQPSGGGRRRQCPAPRSPFPSSEPTGRPTTAISAQGRPGEIDRGLLHPLHPHRSTQFMEFLGSIADEGTHGQTVRVSSGLFQPIAAEDVALVADVALQAPQNAIVEIAGSERAPLSEIVARYLKTVGDLREVVPDPEARYFGGLVTEYSLVPLGKARLGRIGLDEWLGRSQSAARSAAAS